MKLNNKLAQFLTLREKLHKSITIGGQPIYTFFEIPHRLAKAGHSIFFIIQKLLCRQQKSFEKQQETKAYFIRGWSSQKIGVFNG